MNTKWQFLSSKGGMKEKQHIQYFDVHEELYKCMSLSVHLVLFVTNGLQWNNLPILPSDLAKNLEAIETELWTWSNSDPQRCVAVKSLFPYYCCWLLSLSPSDAKVSLPLAFLIWMKIFKENLGPSVATAIFMCHSSSILISWDYFD